MTLSVAVINAIAVAKEFGNIVPFCTLVCMDAVIVKQATLTVVVDDPDKVTLGCDSVTVRGDAVTVLFVTPEIVDVCKDNAADNALDNAMTCFVGDVRVVVIDCADA